MVEWARKASIEQVRSIRKQILDQHVAKTAHKPGGPSEPQPPEGTAPAPANDELPAAA